MMLNVKLLGVGVALLLVASMVLTACSSGVSQEDYDAVVAERDLAEAVLAQAQVDLAAAEDEIADLQDQVADLEAEIKALKPVELPDLLSVVDEFEAMTTAPDRAAQAAAFGDLSTAIEALDDDDLSSLLGDVVTAGLQGDEEAAVAILDMATYMLSACADSVAAFPAEVQPMLELSDDLNALLAAEDLAAKVAVFGELSTAIDAIGDDELTALLQAVVTGGMQSDLDGALATIDLVIHILSQAAEAVQ